MNAKLTEIVRLITNLICTGVVIDVGRKNWLCRVKIGELETSGINWLTCHVSKLRTGIIVNWLHTRELVKKEAVKVQRNRKTTTTKTL